MKDTRHVAGLTKAIIIGFIVCAAVCLVSCTKDAVLGFANAVMTNVGDNRLTKGYDLLGKRKFGIDSYTGKYTAQIEDGTAREILFGSTSIERGGGNTVQVHAEMTGTDGDAVILLERDGEDPEPILTGNGTIDEEFDVSPGSAYFLFECQDYTGDVELTIE